MGFFWFGWFYFPIDRPFSKHWKSQLIRSHLYLSLKYSCVTLSKLVELYSINGFLFLVYLSTFPFQLNWFAKYTSSNFPQPLSSKYTWILIYIASNFLGAQHNIQCSINVHYHLLFPATKQTSHYFSIVIIET